MGSDSLGGHDGHLGHLAMWGLFGAGFVAVAGHFLDGQVVSIEGRNLAI